MRIRVANHPKTKYHHCFNPINFHRSNYRKTPRSLLQRSVKNKLQFMLVIRQRLLYLEANFRTPLIQPIQLPVIHRFWIGYPPIEIKMCRYPRGRNSRICTPITYYNLGKLNKILFINMLSQISLINQNLLQTLMNIFYKKSLWLMIVSKSFQNWRLTWERMSIH